MPYIITTRIRDPRWSVTHRAVATLEDAQKAAWRVVSDRHGNGAARTPAGRALLRAARALEPGGTVGPLPDGTVIEVERVHVADLYRCLTPGTLNLPKTNAWPDFDGMVTRVIDAYNAMQSS